MKKTTVHEEALKEIGYKKKRPQADAEEVTHRVIGEIHLPDKAAAVTRLSFSTNAVVSGIGLPSNKIA